MSFIQSRLNVHPDTVSFRTSFENDVAHHAYVTQQVVCDTRFTFCINAHYTIRVQNGVTIANAVANVAFNKANEVVSFGSSFVNSSTPLPGLFNLNARILIKLSASVPSTTPSVSLEDAISTAESQLSGKFNEHPATLEFVAKKDGSLALTHVVQIQNDDTGAWYQAFVDAHSGEIVQLTDFVAKASVSPALAHFRADGV